MFPIYLNTGGSTRIPFDGIFIESKSFWFTAFMFCIYQDLLYESFVNGAEIPFTAARRCVTMGIEIIFRSHDRADKEFLSCLQH